MIENYKIILDVDSQNEYMVSNDQKAKKKFKIV